MSKGQRPNNRPIRNASTSDSSHSLLRIRTRRLGAALIFAKWLMGSLPGWTTSHRQWSLPKTPLLLARHSLGRITNKKYYAFHTRTLWLTTIVTTIAASWEVSWKREISKTTSTTLYLSRTTCSRCRTASERARPTTMTWYWAKMTWAHCWNRQIQR